MALYCFVAENINKYERYVEIVIGNRKGSAKQNDMLSKYRFAFALACEGYTAMTISKVLAEKYDISQSRGFKIIKEAKIIFGDAGEFSKKGMKYAMYEYFMGLSKKSEKAGDYTNARNCAKDAAIIMELDQPDHEGALNPYDFVNPSEIEFVISTNPKVLDAYEKTIELTIDVDHSVVEPQKVSNGEEEGS